MSDPTLYFPHHASFDLVPILNNTFQGWKVKLPEGPREYKANTQDFGIQIEQLLMAKECQTKKINPAKSAMAHKTIWDGIVFYHTARNMDLIAQRLGFALERADSFYYVRDYFIRLIDGTLAIAHTSKELETALHRTHSSNLYLNKTAATRTKNQLFNSWSGYPKPKDSKLFQSQTQITPFSYSYVEGGNVFILTNQKGEVKVCIGADHLTQTLHMLDLEHRSWEELGPFSTLVQEIAPSLTVDQIKQHAEEMFAEGVWLQNGKSGLIDRKEQLHILLTKFFLEGAKPVNQGAPDWFRTLAIERGAIERFHLPDEAIEPSRRVVAEYLAKKKITQALIARDFKIAPNHLHFITQANFHLDIFLTPGPQQSVFINDYGLTAAMLEALTQVPLSPENLTQLQGYIETAKKLDQELGPLLLQAKRELEEAGFALIPMPAHVCYESKTLYQEFPMPSEGVTVNFSNALTGWSSATGRYYYITQGIQVGQRLGELLMDAFSLYLQHYIPDIEVYFIGRNSKNLADLTEAMDWWNRIETQSGIHCKTFELSSKTHNML